MLPEGVRELTLLAEPNRRGNFFQTGTGFSGEQPLRRLDATASQMCHKSVTGLAFEHARQVPRRKPDMVGDPR